MSMFSGLLKNACEKHFPAFSCWKFFSGRACPRLPLPHLCVHPTHRRLLFRTLLLLKNLKKTLFVTSSIFEQKLEHLWNERRYSTTENVIVFSLWKAFQISISYFLLHRHFKLLRKESLMKFRLERDSNPWPLRYRCSALPFSYQANWELVIVWIRYIPVEEMRWKWIYENSYIWTAEERMNKWMIIVVIYAT